MTQEEIFELARESDLGFLLGDSWLMHHEIEYFAKLVAEKEREACAERAWIALVKHKQPWNIRQDVTEAIKGGQA